MTLFPEIIIHDYTRPMGDRRQARKFCGPYRWQPTAPGKGRGFYSSQSDALKMDRAGSTLDLRLESANDHLSGSRLSFTDGYFCDLDGDGDTLQPVIARLPRGRGFLAGWTMGAGMCGSLDSTVYDEEADAAFAAHRLAESDAESNRDRQEAERAEDEEEFA